MKYRFLITIISLIACFTVYADNVQFTASAPQAVVAGQQFKLVYSLNESGKDIRLGEITGLDIAYGPSTASSHSMSFVNGKRQSTSSYTYTYVLVGLDAGDFKIPAASITVNGKEYKSNALSVKVLPEDQAPAQSTSRGQTARSNSSQNIKGDQLFVRQIFSKTNVYKQEAILVTYKLYTRYDLRGFEEVNFPELKGFYAHEIELDKNLQLVPENYKGINYNTCVLKQAVLFPQKDGKIDIAEGSLSTIILLRNNSGSYDPFADFFNSYQEVKRTVKIPKTSINVKALPANAPKDFNGAVGDFKVNSTISANEIKANEAVTVKFTISGSGNFKLINTPKVEFPNDFDVYDAKVNTNIKSVANASGTKTFEYLAIPRFGGDFVIPPISFSYFNTKTGQYKTLKSPEYKLKVDGTGVDNTTVTNSNGGTYVSSKESVKHLGSDIKYINSAKSSDLTKQGNIFYGTTLFWMSFVVPFLLFVLICLALQNQIKENANIALRRTKGANKLAVKRLKSANAFMKANDKKGFYEETMRALWGYLSDKLNIPVANLSKENVSQELLNHNVNDEMIKEFLNTLADCEFARFAPVVDESLSMQNIYNRAVQLISKLNSVL